MKRLGVASLLLLGFMNVGHAADMSVKAAPSAAPASPWDFAFGSALMTDYIFRGITQSNHQPSVAAYVEPRYNFNDNLQAYAGVSGESISFPNRAAAEIDLYTGIRPTFGKLALDFGFWEYWYPGGSCFNAAISGDCSANADPNTGGLPINGNVIKADLSFWELYGKATYTASDQLALNASLNWSPSVLNSGAEGTFINGNVKYTLPAFTNGVGWFLSADVGHWFLGTSDSFYCTQSSGMCGSPFPGGIPYKSYTTWDVGLAFTYKVFTLDFRYYDTDLNKGDCNAFTSAQNARFDGSFTSINPGGYGTNWCGSTFVVKFSADLTNVSLK